MSWREGVGLVGLSRFGGVSNRAGTADPCISLKFSEPRGVRQFVRLRYTIQRLANGRIHLEIADMLVSTC